MRRVAHALLAAVGAALWLALAAGSCLLVALAVLGHRVWPQADRGNCWTYVLARWPGQGGELRIALHRVGWLRVPHAAWARPDGVIEQTEPVRRARTLRQAWGGLRLLYFRFRTRQTR